MGRINNPGDRSFSRDVWSHGEGNQLRDLISSALLTLMLMPSDGRAAYFSSPWMSDFTLFDNRFRQVGGLFPRLADSTAIKFSDFLRHLSQTLPVRLITARTETSLAFLRVFGSIESSVEYRFAPDAYHEKGILAPSLYIEGSMNITYSGLYVRGEKVTYHVDSNNLGAKKISAAYLEFNRRWSILA